MAFVILHQSIVGRDAIGWDIQQEYRVLSGFGPCYLYCQYLIGIEGCERISKAELLEFVKDSGNIVIYHHSNFWEFGEEVLSTARGPVVIRYHNITPPGFFRRVPEAWRTCVLGREQVFRFAHRFPEAVWLTDSRYNLAELGLDGMSRSVVVPPFAGLAHAVGLDPDAALLRSLIESPVVNVLCTGRFVPNKGHLFVVEVIRSYVAKYGTSILVIVLGKLDPNFRDYHDRVLTAVRDYGLEANFHYAGEVTDAELLSHYLGCDLYLCCSEHEGFCVPVVESQFAHLPVVARNRSAVPETLGAGQILLGEDPDDYADAIHRLRTSDDFRERVIRAGRLNYDTRFTPEAMQSAFLNALRTYAVLPQ